MMRSFVSYRVKHSKRNSPTYYSPLIKHLIVSGVSKKLNPFHHGGSLDTHKAIGKFPKPKSGFTLPGHKCTGPYSPLDKQLRYDKNTGEILDIYDKPNRKTDDKNVRIKLIVKR